MLARLVQWPVLIKRTPKCWSGPKNVDGEFVEGSFYAHPIPSVKAKTSKEQLGYLQKWLLSYGPEKVFTETGEPVDSIKSIIPVVEQNKLGQSVESYNSYEPLNFTDWKKFGVEKETESLACKL